MTEFLQTISRTVAGMRGQDYLDIALVTLLIYKLIPMIRSTSAMRIAKVITMIVAIAWVTEIMGMLALSWLFDQLLAVGLVAIVILFQPELRRMLDHISNMKLGDFFSPHHPAQNLDSVISQTVMACEAMSRERVGALIVFSREMPLDEYFKTGTVIDGQVSEQLIRNIFFPKAALHDGAMIIRDGRVTAAACVLPLSDSNRLSADLGTRHRAGVGMSEATDAVVVIVSEETGAISVAIGGMLKRHLAPQTLERLLCNELRQEEPVAEESLVLRLRQKLRSGKETSDGEK